jgi:hypothetical protein
MALPMWICVAKCVVRSASRRPLALLALHIQRELVVRLKPVITKELD